jgi:glycosyltransferase involved in cell wall biosynthesis
VLVLSRSYPTDVLPDLGLWIERPTELLADVCDMRVVAPVPYCPPLPSVGPLRQYARFRRIPARGSRGPVEVLHPRFASGPGRTLYGLEARAIHAGLRKGVRALREVFPFDLVHAHFIYPEGAVAHWLSLEHGVPFVVSEHAPWSDGWFARGRVRHQALAASGAASALLPVSTSVRATMLAYGVEPGRARVIPVGVDPERFPLGRPGGQRSDAVLYVGQVNFNKGVDVLLQAMSLLESRDAPGRLTIVGGSYYRNGAAQERDLRRYASSLELGGRVAFAGRLPHDEVARLMRESAVVVLPSRAESFGAVLVESLASGTPVVATRCGGPEDIVTDDVGFLVSPEDPNALADAIAAVLRDRASYTAEELRARALSRFSWHEVVARTHEEYARAVGSSEVVRHVVAGGTL